MGCVLLDYIWIKRTKSSKTKVVSSIPSRRFSSKPGASPFAVDVELGTLVPVPVGVSLLVDLFVLKLFLLAVPT